MRRGLEQEHVKELERAKQLIEQRAKDELNKKLETLAAERDGVIQKVKELEAREATIRQTAVEEAERATQERIAQAEEQRKNELLQQRELLEKDRDETVLKRQAEFAREKEFLQRKILEMDR